MPALTVENLSKWYLLRGRKGFDGRLYERVSTIAGKMGLSLPAYRPASGIWALDDIGFAAEPGEVFGIIGPNGAGKTTLLKILARVTLPTKGRVAGRGRVVSLLELGMGFQPDLSPVDNVFLNAALHGIPRGEVERRLDRIMAFAELERFADTPVKRFSSGMYVRLAFSVAINMDPDILLADEVLAVGDIAFQERCVERVMEIARAGTTVLFVSHDMAAIGRMCERVLWLDQGKMVALGPAGEVVAGYEDAALSGNAGPPGGPKGKRKGFLARNDWITLRSAELVSRDLRPVAAIASTDPATIRFTIDVERTPTILRCGFAVSARSERKILLFRSIQPPEIAVSEPGRYVMFAHIPANTLNAGTFSVKCSAASQVDGVSHTLAQENAVVIKVFRTDDTAGRRDDLFADTRQPGLIAPAVEWRCQPPAAKELARERNAGPR